MRRAEEGAEQSRERSLEKMRRAEMRRDKMRKDTREEE